MDAATVQDLAQTSVASTTSTDTVQARQDAAETSVKPASDSNRDAATRRASHSIVIPVNSSSQNDMAQGPRSSAGLSRSSESSHLSTRSSFGSTGGYQRRPGSRILQDRANTSTSSIHETGIDLGVGLPSVGAVQSMDQSLVAMEKTTSHAKNSKTESIEAPTEPQQVAIPSPGDAAEKEAKPPAAPEPPSAVKKIAPMRRDRLSMGMSLPFMRNRVVSDQDVLFDAPRPTTVQTLPAVTTKSTEPSEKDKESLALDTSDASTRIAALSIPSPSRTDKSEAPDTPIAEAGDEPTNDAQRHHDVLSRSISYDDNHPAADELMSPIVTKQPSMQDKGAVEELSVLELSSLIEGLGASPSSSPAAPVTLLASSTRPASAERPTSSASQAGSAKVSPMSGKFPDALARQQAFYSSSTAYKRPISSHDSPSTPSLGKKGVVQSQSLSSKASPATPSLSSNVTLRKQQQQQPKEPKDLKEESQSFHAAAEDKSRPSSSDSTNHTDEAELKPAHDISFSFEPSFVGTELDSRPTTSEALHQRKPWQLGNERNSTQTPVQQRIAMLQGRSQPANSPASVKSTPLQETRLQMHRRTSSELSDLSDEGTPGLSRMHHADEQTHTPGMSKEPYASPMPGTDNTADKALAHRWETPIAAKNYAKDAPTDTAIAKRVEKFQILAEQLQALQPSIEALRAETILDRGHADRLTVKEISARIDSLQKENFGLKLKVMFLERHFSGEVDQDKTALRNESVRLGTIATDLVNKNRALERQLKTATEQVAALELDKAKASTALVKVEGASQREIEIQEKLLDAEAQIERLENEEDVAILDLKDDLADAHDQIAELQAQVEALQAAQNGQSRYGAELARAERQHQRELNHYHYVWTLKFGDAANDKELTEKNNLLADAEAIAAQKSDELFALAAQHREKMDYYEEQLRLYQAEAEERERYIEDRHAEIDDIRHAKLMRGQDSFDARVQDAVKPHEQAWRQKSEECAGLQMQLQDKMAAYDADRHQLESELADAVNNEQDLAAENEELSRRLGAREMECATLRRALKESEQHGSGPESLHALERTVETLTAERQEQRLSHRVLEQKLQEMADKNGALEVDLESRQAQLRTLQQDLEEAQRTVPVLEQQAADQRDRIATLDAKCQAYEADLAEAYAARDEAIREAELARRKLAQGLQADANVEEATQSLARDLEAATARWQEAQQDASRARAEFAKVRQAIESLEGYEAASTLPEALTNVMKHQSSQVGQLSKRIAQLQEAKEKDAFAQAAQARAMEKLEKERAALQRQAETNRSSTDKSQQTLQQRIAELDELNKAMHTQAESQAKQHQTDEQVVKSRDALLEAMLAKLADLLADEAGGLPPTIAGAPKPTQDFVKFKDALFAVLQRFQQQRQLARGDHRQAESEARKKCARLEAQLRERGGLMTKLESKMRDMDLSLIEAKQQVEQLKSDNEDLTGRRIRTMPASRGVSNTGTVVGPAASIGPPMASSTATAASGEEETVAMLRLRLEAMARELKRTKELRHEEHNADKKRLADQKRENRQLKEQMHLRLENGSTRPASSVGSSVKYVGE